MNQQQFIDHLSRFGQQHLVRFWDELDEVARRRLADQIGQIDFEALDRLFHLEASGEDLEQLARRAQPPTAFRLEGGHSPFSADDAHSRGQRAIEAGKVGVILVAGGQGTRLGFDHPKGLFPIGPVSGASLFQILLEQIVARSRRHGVEIPLYLMTSDATHAQTVEFLESNDRFGLAENQLHVFCQGTMPVVEMATGHVLLAEKGEIARSPDGHGGMLAALRHSGLLDEIRKRGIEQLFYAQVDNPLVSMCDASFLGYHILAGSELSTQVVAKRTLRDKVGNVVTIDGKLRILEYSDLNPLPDEILGRIAADGSPVFWAGNTAVHVFERRLLERATGDAEALPFHIAKKAVAHIDAAGKRVEPQGPNAIKFERFIFDLLPSARTGIVVEVNEEVAFAPVKNAPGDERDTPELVQQQMIALHRKWLEAAGARVQNGVAVEISPLFAQDAEEVRERLSPEFVVSQPHYFTSHETRGLSSLPSASSP